MTIETIAISSDVRVRIEYDSCPANPMEDFDNLGTIAYLSRSRYTLGNQAVSHEEMDEIAADIRSGKLVGMPVQAYVHSGVALKASLTNPYPDPRWDSGQSGYVYCTREAAIKEFGNKVCTAKVKEKALKLMASEVETFSQYLNGEVYGFIVERFDEDGEKVEELESCWGFYGLEYCMSEAESAARYHVEASHV